MGEKNLAKARHDDLGRRYVGYIRDYNALADERRECGESVELLSRMLRVHANGLRVGAEHVLLEALPKKEGEAFMAADEDLRERLITQVVEDNGVEANKSGRRKFIQLEWPNPTQWLEGWPARLEH